MIKGYTKQTIIICFLLQGIALSSRAQEQQMWQRYHDKCRGEASIIDTLPSKLEKALHWSPTINKEQKEVIRYILWNMVYVEGGTANLGDNNNYPVDVASFSSTDMKLVRMNGMSLWEKILLTNTDVTIR